MNALLISTYELGRQPFGLASPAAWLRKRAGASVACLDLSREPLRPGLVRSADFVAFYVPMHTATRLAVQVLPEVRELNPRAHLCFYGLYAPVNEPYLRKLGAQTILGGEFEEGLVSACRRVQASQQGEGGQPEPVISLARQQFLVPDRLGLPSLGRYAHLHLPDSTTFVVGYTEASRGCKHLCRHCPVVPVYGGKLRIIPRDVILADIRQQVMAGAEHITFGDPDFFNGPRHAMALVEAFEEEFPNITYDVTIKVEHLLKQAHLLPTLRGTGCLFVTSAVEAMDDEILAKLDKGHRCADVIRVVELLRKVGLNFAPTFVAFTPWTTLEGYCELLRHIAELDLINNLAPIQLALRLLIPAGSRLLELAEIREGVGAFNEAALIYPWVHRDPRVDDLWKKIEGVVQRRGKEGKPRHLIFSEVWRLAHHEAGRPEPAIPGSPDRVARAAIPYLTEPWYC